MSNFKLKKSFKYGKFIFYPIVKQQIFLDRVLVKKIDDSKYILTILDNKSLGNIRKQETSIKRALPNKSRLKSNITNNKIGAFTYNQKGKMETIIKPINMLEMKDNECLASVSIFFDTIYCYNNNPNNFFYKIKIYELDYILE